MSNLDDVIKDILKNIYYDSSKSIYEQNNLISEIGMDGGDERIAGGKGSKEYKQAMAASEERERFLQRQKQPGGMYYYGVAKAEPLKVENSPVRFKGIQRNLDFIVPKSNASRIEVLEYHHTNTPYDQKKATELFGNWCKALSTGDMTGKSGEEFWYDTTSPELKQCSASTVVYRARTLPNKPDTIDSNYGLTDIRSSSKIINDMMSTSMSDFLNFTGINKPKQANENYIITNDNKILNEEGGGWIGQDIQKMREHEAQETAEKEYWKSIFGGYKKPEIDKRTKQEREVDKRKEQYLGKLKTEKEKEQEKKERQEYLKTVNKRFADLIKKDPNYEPVKGWGKYQKNWDCVAGDCGLVGRLVRLPISKITGKPVYKQFLNEEGKETCRPMEYNYCLQISWSLFNGNAQANSMKKFKFKPLDPMNVAQRIAAATTFSQKTEKSLDIATAEASIYLACTSQGLENTLAKGDIPYPWDMRYDGYCLSKGGEVCDSVKKGSYSVCETNLNNLDEFFELDLRETTAMNIPGNKIPIYSDDFKGSAKEIYGKQHCKQCIPLIDNPVYTTAAGEEIDCADHQSANEKYGGYSPCRETVLRACQQDCMDAGTNEDVTDEAQAFASGSVVFGKI